MLIDHGDGVIRRWWICNNDLVVVVVLIKKRIKSASDLVVVGVVVGMQDGTDWSHLLPCLVEQVLFGEVLQLRKVSLRARGLQ